MSVLKKNSVTVMKQLKDYVRVYDEVIDKDLAKKCIDLFESNTDKHDRVETENLKPQFTQLNFTQLYKESEESKIQHEPLHYLLQTAFMGCVNLYKTELNIGDNFPYDIALEEFRIKKYKPDGLGACDAPSGRPDQFAKHVDVLDYNSARRYLGFFLYLNEPEQGETVFPNWSQWIKPKCGRMMVFPPTWMFPHEGRPCRKFPKYIVGSYLHYL